MRTKRQDLPKPGRPGGGTLLVVATPIGNLDDLSGRAIEALKDADAILCEDTRRTRILAEHIGAKARLERFDAHSSPKDIERVIERVLAGEILALVSDAGTPAVSDPGAKLCRKAHEKGARVVPIPGPSAAVTLLSASGLGEHGYGFLGFFPRKSAEIQTLAQEVARFARPLAWIGYESPHRVRETLAAWAAVDPEAQVCAGKEITKQYEQLWSGSIAEVRDQLERHFDSEGEKGEWVIAIEPSQLLRQSSDDRSVWINILQTLMDAGVSASRAAREVSQSFGVAKNAVYEAALEIDRAREK